MKKKLVYQGCPGAFGHISAFNFADKQKDCDFYIYSVPRFEDVANEVILGNANFGILPFENSKTGGVIEVLDILLESDLYIIGEEIVKVVHNLLGLRGVKIEDIKTVMSHPQAISQCRGFLSFYDSKWEVIPKLNTAESAKIVSESNNKSMGAIASSFASKIYDLNIIKESINDNLNNFTRFVVVSNKPNDKKNQSNKCSLIFSVSNRCGALLEVLEIFKNNNLNLTKIESRPYPSKKFEYIFFADLEGNFTTIDMDKIFGQIVQKSRLLKILGFYDEVKA